MNIQARCVTLHGEPGIGKSTLANAVSRYMAKRFMFDRLVSVDLSVSNYAEAHFGKFPSPLACLALALHRRYKLFIFLQIRPKRGLTTIKTKK